ncbi:hypothetical protein [Deinococcus apachensis]|uniref:hypothetical protein n=1 Tax=Deinococcus apachensis TaxID=309886 RepID=UPI0003744565|nr:hypothetical protein [Deinococcus apachensis]
MADEPVFQMTFGEIDLDPVPPREAVTFDGGGYTTTERRALDGTIIRQRPGQPASRRLTITAPQGFVIRAEQADALFALAKGGARFTLVLRGYVLNGSYGGCTFEGLPKFPPTGDPKWRGYSIEIYIPQ